MPEKQLGVPSTSQIMRLGNCDVTQCGLVNSVFQSGHSLTVRLHEGDKFVHVREDLKKKGLKKIEFVRVREGFKKLWTFKNKDDLNNEGKKNRFFQKFQQQKNDHP